MSFLSIAFLLALPLAAAPLLLHWFDRRRNTVIDWGAMEFLVEASSRKTSARRLKQWLLLLMRCLALLALVFALARPLLPSGYLGGHQRGETIFVIDNSMSMMRKTADAAMIEDAADAVIRSLQEMPATDEFRILTTAPYPVWSGTGSLRNDPVNRAAVAKQLRALSATQGSSDLLASLFTAIQADDSRMHSGRKIVVLTDGQASDWRLNEDAGWQRFHEAMNANPVPTTVEIVRLDGAESRRIVRNVAVDRMSLGSAVVGVGREFTITAQLRNHGDDESAAAPMIWAVDGQDQFEEQIESIEGQRSSEVTWTHVFDEAGIYRVSCRLDWEDDLSGDNESSVVVEVVDQLPVVVVEEAFEFAEMQQDSYFVQAALGWIDGQPLDESSIYVPTALSPDELATADLSQQRVVVVPNLTRLSADAVTTLRDFVADGGGLWIGLGPRTDIDAFNHQFFADASGLSPVRLDRIVDSGALESAVESGDDAEPVRRARIDPFRSEHPATRQLADDQQSDIGDARVNRRMQFVADETTADLSVLLSLNDGSPLAAENYFGRGRVIVQGVPLRLQWSDMARTQSFVVMVRDWIDYLAGPGATKYNLEPGEPIELRKTASIEGSGNDGTNASSALLTTPQDDAIELTAERQKDALVYRSSRTRLPGAYQLEIGLADQVVPFQVSRDSEESDLRSLTSAAEQQIWTATQADDPDAESVAVASTQSDPLWPYLLIGLIMLITGDLVLSGMLSRERFGSAGIPEHSELDAEPLGSTLKRRSPQALGGTPLSPAVVSQEKSPTQEAR